MIQYGLGTYLKNDKEPGKEEYELINRLSVNMRDLEGSMKEGSTPRVGDEFDCGLYESNTKTVQTLIYSKKSVQGGTRLNEMGSLDKGVEINKTKEDSDLENGTEERFARPSTPSSCKISRLGTSDYVHETSPSSVDDETCHLDPKPENASTQSTYDTIDPNGARAKLASINLDPLEKPANLSSETLKLHETQTSKGLASNTEPSNVPPTFRRHTSPVSTLPQGPKLTGSKALTTSNVIRTPKNSVPPNRRSGSLASTISRRLNYDSTSHEISRMKNSSIMQSKLLRRKKDVEDDRVLVGTKISEGHENFVMAYNMLTGIRVAVSRCSGVMESLNNRDFSYCKKLTFNMDGSELTPSSRYDFKFKDYSPAVFRELRNLFGIDPADYLISVTGKYILSELGSPGKSGSFFYYSRDYRFIIKTIHHSEHKQLRKILQSYYKHVKSNPNTLLSQFYGLHRVKMRPYSSGLRKVYFVVMNNLFPPHRDIHLKYDLKGSTWGRRAKIKMGDDVTNKTLKDLDWLQRDDKIKFGPEKRKLFFDQLTSDVGFLESINVMDYSLLVGIHDVKKGNSMEKIQKLSIFDPKSRDSRDIINTNPRDINLAEDLPSSAYPKRLKYIFYGHDGGIRATNESNEPLPEIYYLGVIDYLTNYSFRKRLETCWRTIGHPRSTISAVPAGEYGDRFINFIKKGTTQDKHKID